MTELMDTTDSPDVSTEILECQKQLKYWGDRLEKLKASVRRKTVLALIECASWEGEMRRLWSQLTPEEQEDSEIVYKILSSGKNVFGYGPWGDRRFRWEAILPAKFSSDPKAVLAFLSAPPQSRPPSFSGLFTVPDGLRDNKEVMLVATKKTPEFLKQCSPRLRDDDELVRACLFSCDNSTDNHTVLKHASERLRADTGLIRTLLERTVRIGRDNDCSFDWLEFAILDLTEERAVAHTILSHASEIHLSDTKFLEHFSEEVRDDNEIMLRFVSLNWESLQWCSARLKQVEQFVQAAVSQNVRAYSHALGAIREQYVKNRTVESVLEEIANGSCEIPESMKTNRSVIMAALKARLLPWLLHELPEYLRHDKEVVLVYIEAKKKVNTYADLPPLNTYADLPPHLQNDEEIAIALLKALYYRFEEIFDRLPVLIRNREAMLAAARYNTYGRFGEEYFPLQCVEKSPLRDDADFMLAISEYNVDYLKHASNRLLSDHDFLEAACTERKCYFIACASPEFQMSHIDLVVRGIESCPSCAKDKFAERVHSGVWSHRPVVLAWLANGWPILQKLASVDPNSTFLSDRVVVTLSVSNEPADLQYAAPGLRSDRGFILSLVQQARHVLLYAAETFRKDDEILTAAIARNGGRTIGDCFQFDEGFRFLSGFTVRVRTKLKLHQIFCDTFLRGMLMHDQSNGCQLPLLDRGLETGTAFKRKIAEYVGVPLGAEFHSLQATSAVLEKFGY